MKKIILFVTILLVFGTGITRANMIYPEEQYISIEKLCKGLREEMADADTSKARMEVVRKQFTDFNCEQVLQGVSESPASQPQADSSKVSTPTPNNTTHETGTKQNMRAYELAGLVALILSIVAFILLWRTRKTNLSRVP